MTDTVKIQITQTDEATNEAISDVVVNWYGFDRDTANVASLSIVGAIRDQVEQWAKLKAGKGE